MDTWQGVVAMYAVSLVGLGFAFWCKGGSCLWWMAAIGAATVFALAIAVQAPLRLVIALILALAAFSGRRFFRSRRWMPGGILGIVSLCAAALAWHFGQP